MRYLLDAIQSKKIDQYSITSVGIPSLVLMERAALSVTECVLKQNHGKNFVCVCGSGNNGADGLAVARLLHQAGESVSILLIGGMEKKGTQEYEIQKNIVLNLHIPIVQTYDIKKYDVVVDAIFGIGLSREISGVYADVIEKINQDKCKVISVDIPSGIDATSGNVFGCAVRADETVTFGYEKLGMSLYPGAEHSGNIIVADIGFAIEAQNQITDKVFTYEMSDLDRIPERKSGGNKGTYGKVLIAAGSENMGGAAIFSGLAAYRSGCGLVKILTNQVNHHAILQFLPEAVMSLYSDESDGDFSQMCQKDCDWADCIVLGPGISQENVGKELTNNILNYAKVPLILDADGLNIVAQKKDWDYGKEKEIIITPHMGEMSRLTGLSIAEIKKNPIEVAKAYASKKHVVCVLKDARTVVTDGKQIYVNTSGSDALATGGSGDVLTGVIAGMVVCGMTLFDAAVMGCFVHGLSGQQAGNDLGNRAVTARDVADYVGKVLK